MCVDVCCGISTSTATNKEYIFGSEAAKFLQI